MRPSLLSILLVGAACTAAPAPADTSTLPADSSLDTRVGDAAMRDADSAAPIDATADSGGDADATRVDGGMGTLLGDVWITYYYYAIEDDYSGAADTTLYDGSCRPIADVPASFSDAICIEGSGRLSDGRVLNFDSTCSCGRPCPTGGTICYTELDPTRFPWGQGNRGNALEPLRSWATDRSLIPSGTVVYSPEWDGVFIPDLDGLGGFVHDGCFRADDVGGAITGDHVDVFAGTSGMWRALEAIHPTRTRVTVYVDPPRCASS